MLADLGLITLTLAFILAIYASVAAAYGGWRARSPFVESARNAVLVTYILLTGSVLILIHALVTMDFSLAYVTDVTSRAMSTFLRVTALWGGQAGPGLFWSWVVAGFVALVSLRTWGG